MRGEDASRHLVEDSSGAIFLDLVIPKILGPHDGLHTWRIHSYKGIGHLPKDLGAKADPSKQMLLHKLPALLRGFGKTPGIDRIIVVADADNRNCAEFLAELKQVAETCGVGSITLFRLAVEEMEAWYLGDRQAVLAAYPRAKKPVLDRYKHDSICGTWETFADAVHKGGAAAIRKVGWPASGVLKHEWAKRIGPSIDIERNESPSFRKFRDGLRRLVTAP